MKKQLLSELVATSDISTKKIKAVLDHYDEKIGLSGLFWNSLRQDPRLGPEIADEVQFTLKLGELSMYHLPLIHELQQLRKDKVVTQVQDLLELDWMSLIMKRVKGKRIGTPPDVPGETEDEKVRNYAEALSVRVPRLFPSAVIARQVETLLKEPKVLRAAKAQIGSRKGKKRQRNPSQKYLRQLDHLCGQKGMRFLSQQRYKNSAVIYR